MGVSKTFLASLTLVLFAAIRSGDSARNSHSKPVCSNTTVTLESVSGNITVIQTNLIKQIWTKVLKQDVSAKVKDYANSVIDSIDSIDSPSARCALYSQASYITAFLPNIDDAPGLCVYAAYINATVEHAKAGKNCREVVNTFTSVVNLTSDVCTLWTVGALCDKCKNLPTVPRLDSKCYRRGRAYDILAALDIFGKNIPCQLHTAIIDLYRSKEYADNAVAIMLIFQLADEIVDFWELYPKNLLIETMNIIVEDTSAHCCHDRLKRLDVLCAQQTAAAVAEAKHVTAELCHEYE